MQFVVQFTPVLISMLTAFAIFYISSSNRADIFAKYLIGPLFPLIILFATLKHTIWAVLLFFHPEVGHITALYDFTATISNHGTIVALLAASVLSLFGWHLGRRRAFSALFLIPQQFILFVIAMGAAHSMWTGVYADGTVRTPAFLVADQITTVLLAMLHTVAIIETATSRVVPVQESGK